MNAVSGFVVSHDISPISAKVEQSALLEAIGGGDGANFRLEISDKEATQVALQLLFSGIRELRERGVSFEVGPIASSLIERSHSEIERPGK